MASWTPISPWRLGKCQTVTIGAGSTSLATVVGSQTRAVLISATSDCHVRIGPATETALATDTLIRSAYPPLVFGCSAGDTVAVIQDAAGGTLYVTELSH